MNERGEAVSTVRGRRQAPALRVLATVACVLGGVGAVVTAGWGSVAATVSLTVVIATPLLRVLWLVFRWIQERDFRFVWIAAGLLSVVAAGAVLAYLGVSG